MTELNRERHKSSSITDALIQFIQWLLEQAGKKLVNTRSNNTINKDDLIDINRTLLQR